MAAKNREFAAGNDGRRSKKQLDFNGRESHLKILDILEDSLSDEDGLELARRINEIKGARPKRGQLFRNAVDYDERKSFNLASPVVQKVDNEVIPSSQSQPEMRKNSKEKVTTSSRSKSRSRSRSSIASSIAAANAECDAFLRKNTMINQFRKSNAKKTNLIIAESTPKINSVHAFNSSVSPIATNKEPLGSIPAQENGPNNRSPTKIPRKIPIAQYLSPKVLLHHVNSKQNISLMPQNQKETTKTIVADVISDDEDVENTLKDTRNQNRTTISNRQMSMTPDQAGKYNRVSTTGKKRQTIRSEGEMEMEISPQRIRSNIHESTPVHIPETQNSPEEDIVMTEKTHNEPRSLTSEESYHSTQMNGDYEKVAPALIETLQSFSKKDTQEKKDTTFRKPGPKKKGRRTIAPLSEQTQKYFNVIDALKSQVTPINSIEKRRLYSKGLSDNEDRSPFTTKVKKKKTGRNGNESEASKSSRQSNKSQKRNTLTRDSVEEIEKPGLIKTWKNLVRDSGRRSQTKKAKSSSETEDEYVNASAEPVQKSLIEQSPKKTHHAEQNEETEYSDDEQQPEKEQKTTKNKKSANRGRRDSPEYSDDTHQEVKRKERVEDAKKKSQIRDVQDVEYSEDDQEPLQKDVLKYKKNGKEKKLIQRNELEYSDEHQEHQEKAVKHQKKRNNDQQPQKVQKNSKNSTESSRKKAELEYPMEGKKSRERVQEQTRNDETEYSRDSLPKGHKNTRNKKYSAEDREEDERNSRIFDRLKNTEPFKNSEKSRNSQAREKSTDSRRQIVDKTVDDDSDDDEDVPKNRRIAKPNAMEDIEEYEEKVVEEGDKKTVTHTKTSEKVHREGKKMKYTKEYQLYERVEVEEDAESSFADHNTPVKAIAGTHNSRNQKGTVRARVRQSADESSSDDETAKEQEMENNNQNVDNNRNESFTEDEESEISDYENIKEINPHPHHKDQHRQSDFYAKLDGVRKMDDSHDENTRNKNARGQTRSESVESEQSADQNIQKQILDAHNNNKRGRRGQERQKNVNSEINRKQNAETKRVRNESDYPDNLNAAGQPKKNKKAQKERPQNLESEHLAEQKELNEKRRRVSEESENSSDQRVKRQPQRKKTKKERQQREESEHSRRKKYESENSDNRNAEKLPKNRQTKKSVHKRQEIQESELSDDQNANRQTRKCPTPKKKSAQLKRQEFSDLSSPERPQKSLPLSFSPEVIDSEPKIQPETLKAKNQQKVSEQKQQESDKSDFSDERNISRNSQKDRQEIYQDVSEVDSERSISREVHQNIDKNQRKNVSQEQNKKSSDDESQTDASKDEDARLLQEVLTKKRRKVVRNKTKNVPKETISEEEPQVVKTSKVKNRKKASLKGQKSQDIQPNYPSDDDSVPEDNDVSFVGQRIVNTPDDNLLPEDDRRTTSISPPKDDRASRKSRRERSPTPEQNYSNKKPRRDSNAKSNDRVLKDPNSCSALDKDVQESDQEQDAPIKGKRGRKKALEKKPKPKTMKPNSTSKTTTKKKTCAEEPPGVRRSTRVKKLPESLFFISSYNIITDFDRTTAPNYKEPTFKEFTRGTKKLELMQSVKNTTNWGSKISNGSKTTLSKGRQPGKNRTFNLLNKILECENINEVNCSQTITQVMPNDGSLCDFSSIDFTTYNGVGYGFYKVGNEEVGILKFDSKAVKEEVKTLDIELRYLVLEGQVQFKVNGARHILNPGSLIMIKPYSTYKIKNSSKPALMILIREIKPDAETAPETCDSN